MRDTSQQAANIAAALADNRRILNLAERVNELQTADKLTVASALLLAGKVELAEAVAVRAVQEIQFARLFGKKQ